MTDNSDTAGIEESGRFEMSDKIHSLAVAILAVVLLLVIYLKALNAPPLLDEDYILTWLDALGKDNGIIASSAIGWTGPELSDTWSYISGGLFALIGTVSSHSTKLFRIINLSLHLASTVLVYLVMARALKPAPHTLFEKKIKWMPVLIALTFSVYPLTAESTFWLGGFAYNLGTMLLLAAYLFYLLAKESKSWTKIGIGCIFYLLALYSDSSLWAASFTLVSLELARDFIGHYGHHDPLISKSTIKETEDIEDAVEKLLEAERDGSIKKEEKVEGDRGGEKAKPQEESVFDTLLPALPFLALGALVPLGSLPTYGTETLASELIIRPTDWQSALKAFWFPVNQSINEGYNKLYSFLYIIYGIGLAVVPVALVRSRQYRQHAIFLFIWLVMAIVPHLHHAITNETITGARWFYHASIPLTALIILYFFALPFAISTFSQCQTTLGKAIATIFSVVLVLLFFFFIFARTRTQIKAFQSATNVVSKLKKSLYSVAGKEKTPFLIVRNVPFYATITRRTSPFNLVLFDSKNQLMKAPKVVDGNLKDLLKDNKFRNLTMHWEHSMVSLLPIDFGVAGDGQHKPFMDAAEIERRLIPPLAYWKTAKFYSEENLFEVFSNWDAGPVLIVSANGFDALGPDFVYIEAKIDTPETKLDSEVELSWLTTWGKELERRDRLAKTRAITNDGKFHRYRFPVRSTAWCTNGIIQQLSFGFPKSATVKIKEIGTEDRPDLIAKLKFDNYEGKRKVDSFVSGYFNYPSDQALGLALCLKEEKELKFDYDVSKVENAAKAVCEISRPDRFFEFPNSYKPGADHLKMLNLKSTAGTIKVKTSDLKEPGVYSFRVLAIDTNGKTVGFASDTINCLINRNIKGDTR